MSTFDLTTQTIDIESLRKNDIINCPYSGEAKQLTLPKGVYKLECWGAQGGQVGASYLGGKGGYSVGILTLNKNVNIYLYVGGKGTDYSASKLLTGGFNGGGNAYTTSSSYSVGSGGGSTDIRIEQDSLYSRVIVAGGGGGAGAYSTNYKYAGGAGGGENGGNGSTYTTTTYPPGCAGTQTSAGASFYGGSYQNNSTYGRIASFGVGGGASGTTYSPVVGGGGGWYGGGYGRRTSGGGGSGYVYTANTATNYPSGCLLNESYYLTDAQTIVATMSMPLYEGGTGTGNTGNGAIRITILDIGSMQLRIKQNGVWTQGQALYIKQNGSWSEINAENVKDHIKTDLKIRNKYIWNKYQVGIDENTKLLLQFDKLPYTDISNNGVTITVTGTANTTDNGKFANAAVFPADASHYIEVEVPNLTTILNTNQWTFDWWEYDLGFSNDSAVFILSSRGAYTMLASYYHANNGGGKHFYASSNGSSWDVAVDVRAGDTIANQWIHRAIVRNGNSIKLFENGILVNEANSSATINTTNNKIRFSNCWNSANVGLNGYIDEFRFSDMPRWSTNFEVPTTTSGLEFISYTFDTNINAYPKDGMADDGYYYKRL